MRKFALIVSALAVAVSSFATTPQFSEVKKQNKKLVVEKQKAVPAGSYGKVAAKKAHVDSRQLISPLSTRADENMLVGYEAPEGFLGLGLSEGFVGYGSKPSGVRKGPAFTPLKWTNISENATEFEWNFPYLAEEDGSVVEKLENYATRDVVRSEDFTEVAAPILYGVDAAGNVAVYQMGNSVDENGELGKPSLWFNYGGDCSQFLGYDEQGMPMLEDFGLTSYIYSINGGGYTIFPCMSYDATDDRNYDATTGLNPVFTTPSPQGFGFESVKLLGYTNVFPVPAASYFITKMWSWVNVQANKPTVVEMNLYKIDEEGYLTDEIIAQGVANVNASTRPQEIMMSFDLFALDEDGLETDDPVVIDGAFMAEMTFNVEDFDIFSCAIGAGATWPVELEDSPYPIHAMMMLEADGQVRLTRSPYDYFTSNERTELATATDFMWMVDAVFPFTFEVNDNTVAEAPAEGGVVNFEIGSLVGLQYYDAVVSEGGDWINIEEATFLNTENGSAILNIPVDALPAGVEGRSATVTLEFYATSLELTINQGKVAAVSVVAADKNAEYYDLQGRRVANPEKGIYIKKTANKAEKVLF